MRDLLVKKQTVDTDYDTYELSYHIHQINEKDCQYYGVSILQYNDDNHEELFDQATIRGFSESFQETKAFFNTIFEEIVFPVHLFSIADDWQGMQM